MARLSKREPARRARSLTRGAAKFWGGSQPKLRPICPRCCNPIETAFRAPRVRVASIDLRAVAPELADGTAARVVALPAVRRFLGALEAARGKVVAPHQLVPRWGRGLDEVRIPGSARHAVVVEDEREYDRTGWSIWTAHNWRSRGRARLTVWLLAFGASGDLTVYHYRTVLAEVDVVALLAQSRAGRKERR